MSLPDVPRARQARGEVVTRRRRFAQVPDDLVVDHEVSAHAVRVWARLDRYAGRTGAAMPSREQLAEDLGLSLATLRRAFGELIARGWISRQRIGASNVWETALNDEPRGPGVPFPRGRTDGETVARKRSPDAISEDNKRSPDAISEDNKRSDKRSDKRSQVSRPRKEKTNDSERTTFSQERAQLAVINVTDDATTADDDSASRRPATTRGTRLPADWEPSPELRDWTRQNAPGIGWAEVEKFRDYWCPIPGQRGVKLDWDATWRNWVRREASRGPGTAGPRRSTTDERFSAAVDLARQLHDEEQAAAQLAIGE